MAHATVATARTDVARRATDMSPSVRCVSVACVWELVLEFVSLNCTVFGSSGQRTAGAAHARFGVVFSFTEEHSPACPPCEGGWPPGNRPTQQREQREK